MGGSMGGSRGGHTARNLFSKEYFSKKTHRSGSRGLGTHFPPPYPGVTPPRIRRTGPPSSDFFGKCFLKKNSTWRTKWKEKYFFNIFFPIVFREFGTYTTSLLHRRFRQIHLLLAVARLPIWPIFDQKVRKSNFRT